MTSIHRASTLGLLTLVLLGSLPQEVRAQKDNSDAWRWNATVYGWVPAIGGSTSFPATGTGPNIAVDAGQVLDALNMTFMGSLEARNGKWGAWTDLVYADFGASKSGSRDFSIGQQQLPVNVSADLRLDLKALVWTAAAFYSLSDKAEGSVDLLFGTRMINLDEQLSWTVTGPLPELPPAARSGTSSVGLDKWDGIIGVKGRISLGNERKWFIPYYLDVGTGQSKMTWQASTGVGYQFGWGSLIASWRYLDYDFKSEQLVRSMNFNGAAIGAQFSF